MGARLGGGNLLRKLGLHGCHDTSAHEEPASVASANTIRSRVMRTTPLDLSPTGLLCTRIAAPYLM
eukprot:8653108-Prorocentrum_lima.AAC.1